MDKYYLICRKTRKKTIEAVRLNGRFSEQDVDEILAQLSKPEKYKSIKTKVNEYFKVEIKHFERGNFELEIVYNIVVGV